ncbi:hypothetical protein BDF19DRAFT_468441 [Syncephalis fuscata]|nr:hypothetical protein BDF19DRAFT_468441 [Syncephalis fuscata]
MTRFASTIGFSACAAALLAVSTISSVSAHGYLSSPAPRGIAKASYMVDDLKSPNTRGICRGEPAGKVTNVGHSVTLGLTITAPHIGMCEVYILDENLKNARKIASKNDCAAPGKVGPWTVKIPSDITGRKVLRWVWNAAHLVTTIEHYEQCADINISGGGGKPSAGKKADESYEGAPAKDTPAKDTPAKGTPSKGTSAKGTPAKNTPAEDTPAEDTKLVHNDKPKPPKDGKKNDGFTGSAPAENKKKPDYSEAPKSSGHAGANDSCNHGKFKCNGAKIGQCNRGSYSWFTCASGTQCRSNGKFVYCGY